jgi:hypothetical protein
LSRAIPVEVTKSTPAFGGEKNMQQMYDNLRTFAEQTGGAASAAASSSGPQELPKQKRSQSRPRFVQ